MNASASAVCFHCGEPLAGSTFTARIDDLDRPVCCAGCRAVAELIVGAGLQDFYTYREGPSGRPEVVAAEDAWAAYGRPEIAAQFTRRAGANESAVLLIEGLRCAACTWLIDRMLAALPGVVRASVNPASGRAHVEWRSGETDLGQLLRAIAQLGYRPHPFSEGIAAEVQQSEKRTALKRLAVAGLGMMQVMMFAVAIYSAEMTGEHMDEGLRAYFRIVSLLVSVPVMFFAGKPFLINAWNSLRTRSIGMDVPVSIALLLAFGASVWNTLRGTGEVYFDSVTMFIFFLTLGRFVEMSVRHRTLDVTDALARQLPAMAYRVSGTEVTAVATASLAAGDIVLVRAGEIVPTDGVVLEGGTRIDEALLTGESAAVQRGAGDRVAAGTLNVLSPVRVRVTAIGSGTLLCGIVALLRRAQAEKPQMAQTADVAAARFLRYVLIVAGVVCAAWLAIDPQRAFDATLAVLVVACPCAFSIAMPAAFAAATAQLARHGVLVIRTDAIEALSRVRRIIFDKTGTLTHGRVRVACCEPLGDLSRNDCMALAAALEQGSEHPIARAFTGVSTQGRVAEQVKVVAGAGIEGVIDGQCYRIGTHGFAATPGRRQEEVAVHAGATVVVLSDGQSMLARFELADTLREDATGAVLDLRALGLETEVVSGDAVDAVTDISWRCGIGQYLARRTPGQKLQRVRVLQAKGEKVAMLGDGINDAPVLGAADVSIAMGAGAALAQASADIVLMGDRLSALPEAVRIARRTMRVARQNLYWAAAYNFSALPLAALGYIPPWVAAVGMSLSSVAVMLNAMRLLPARNALPAACDVPDAAQRAQGLPAAATTSGVSHA